MPLAFAGLATITGDYWLDVVGIVLIVSGVMISAWRKPMLYVRIIFWVIRHTIYRWQVYGLENIPKSGPVLLVSNHASFLDSFLIMWACPRPVRFVTQQSYFHNPILCFFLSWFRAIPVPPGSNIHSVRDLAKTVLTALENGEVVAVFAEGGRTRNGHLRRFHRGIEMFGRESNVPFIPVYLANVWGSIFSYYGGRIYKKFPRSLPHRITVAIGKPLPPSTPAHEIRLTIHRLSAEVAIHAAHWMRPPHRAFVRRAAHQPFRNCIIDTATKRQLNYGKALAGAIVLSRWLKSRLTDAPMVGVWLPSSLGGALTNIALAFLGKTSVNLNYTASEGSVRSSAKQTNLRQIITSKMFVRRMPLTVPHTEGPATEDSVQVIYLEDAAPQISNISRFLAFLQVVLLPGWFLDYFVLRLGKHRLDDLATVIFSSGSTGEPKGIVLSNRNIAANVDSIGQVIDIGPKDCLLGCLPFFHSFGYTVTLWAPLQLGASVVYHPDPRQAKEIGEICRTWKCTIMLSTPTFLRFYLKRSGVDDYKSVRILITGAEKLPPGLAAEFKQRFGVEPLEGYGCTETAPVVSSNIPDVEINLVKQTGNRVGTIGHPLPGICVKIVHPETMADLPLGENGMILVYGANVMVGYLGKPEMTAAAIHNGWYITGDIGHLDKDGFVTITGRVSRFAKIGGEMVPLEKVEEELHAALETNERVGVVTAVPDEAKGERLIVLHLPLSGTDTRQVVQKLSDRGLPNLWVPKERDFFEVQELPLLGSGKVDLKRLRDIAIDRVRGVGNTG